MSEFKDRCDMCSEYKESHPYPFRIKGKWMHLCSLCWDKQGKCEKMNEVTDSDIERLHERRKERFAIEITESEDDFGKTATLRITGNGNQWFGITFESQDEIDRAIKALSECDAFKK